MQTDINNPKTKSVNICYQNMKNNMYIVIFAFVALSLMKTPSDSVAQASTALQLTLYFPFFPYADNSSNRNESENMTLQHSHFLSQYNTDKNKTKSQSIQNENLVVAKKLAPASKPAATAAKPGTANSKSDQTVGEEEDDLLDFGNCSVEGKNYLQIISGGSMLIMVVNVILMFYIWCRIHFARTEFWGTYFMNLIWSAILIFMTINAVKKAPQECPQIIMAQKAIVGLVIKKELEILIFGLFFPREFATRQTNFASNLIFPFLMMTSGDFTGCSKAAAFEGIVFSTCFIHTFILVLGSAFNFAMLCIKRNTGQVFKFYVLLGMFVMAIIYVQNILISKSLVYNIPECTKVTFLQKSYFLIAPFGMVSMLMILCSIRADQGEDQRSEMLQEYQKNIQHEDYVYNIAKASQVNPAQILSQHHNQNKQMEMTKSYGTIFKK